MLRAIVHFLIYVVIILLIPFTAYAQEEAYTVDYTFNFYAQPDSQHLDVDLDIVLTNTRSDVYITEYSIRFPQNFFFKNLRATNDEGSIPFIISEVDSARMLTFKFGEPETGSFSHNRLKIHYTLENMHTQKGRVNEMILPLLISDAKSKVHVTLHLPDELSRELSVSKPIPTSIDFRQIHWEDVTARTIYTLYGDSQVYSVGLGYSLQNKGIQSHTQTIALPPETQYQKVYIDSLKPKPSKTYTDEDGNFLADYDVPARSTLDIQFLGKVEVFLKPQDTLRDYMRAAFEKQQNYLLSQERQWNIEDARTMPAIRALQSADDIFRFVVNTLDYSTARLSDTSVKRYGATKALENPRDAVCTEYTDVFIALAREKGIPAREVIGYGYSESSRIRPQSFILDELHAWPEYYDRRQELWMQVDPTWEDTSGIDYLRGFDSNHIALAIHGKDPVHPLPAGMYKTDRRKDVEVAISSVKPIPLIHVDITSDIKQDLVVGETYSSKLTVTNSGNAFIHTITIIPEAGHIAFASGPITVEYLAPLESREIPITYTVQESYKPTDTISFTYDGAVLGSQDVRLSEKSNTQVQIALGIAVIACILLTGLILFKKVRTHA